MAVIDLAVMVCGRHGIGPGLQMGSCQFLVLATELIIFLHLHSWFRVLFVALMLLVG